MKVFKFLIVFKLLFLCNVLFSQVTIHGKVTEGNNEPLSFATLQLLSFNEKSLLKYTTTDIEGNYSFEIDKKGTYFLKISHISHKTLEQTVVLDKDINTLNFTLEKNVNALKEVVLDFEPKVMKVHNDTINYNLKALTNGTEKNLSDILEKLPGVSVNSSGRISVNGKMVKKLLIDGEELFKNQHQTTTESVGAKMVKGIRYLDKYNDFGNITGFDNKQTNALDVAIKDEYKNKITGDIKVEVGYKDKYLANTNLFKFGGKLKLGIIGNWNTLGKQSITSHQYNELKGIGFQETDQNGFVIERSQDNSPKFLDPTLDVASRDNTFVALSTIFKPSFKTKISLLHIYSKTDQEQFFLSDRQFFNFPELDLLEDRNINSSFLLNTTILNFGFQPSEKSFIEYNFSFNPTKSDETSKISLQSNESVLNVSQILENTQYLLDQKISILNRITKNTLLKFTGLFIKENKDETLDLIANENLFSGIDNNTILQIRDFEKNIGGYQLQSVSNIGKQKLRVEHGTLFTTSFFKTNINDNVNFVNNYKTNRLDNYVNVSFEGKLSRKIRLTTKLGYRFVNLERFDDSFDDKFFQPSISFLYKPKSSKTLSLGYAYTVDLPNESSVSNKNIIENYYTLRLPSQIISNQLLPEHKLNSYYSYYNSSSGSSFSTFISYNFAPEYITTNNEIDENENVLFNNIIGKNKHTFNYGLRFDKRFKNKLGIYSNFNFFYFEKESGLNNIVTQTSNTVYKNKAGVYSRYRKGINFNSGLDVEFMNYKVDFSGSSTHSSIIKPYLILNGSIKKDVLVWNLGSEYSIYQTDVSSENILNIYPSLLYTVNDKFEFSVRGNNILNVDNAKITQNFNTSTYSESQIIATLEGYIVLGMSYKL